MAAKRLTKSAVDWLAFAERVPPAQVEFFKMFKAKSEDFLGKIYTNPESLPKIDFNNYKSNISNKALVTEFEKAYASVSVPYPKDVANMKLAVEEEEKVELKKSQEFIEHMKEEGALYKLMATKIGELPPIEDMSWDSMCDYFPNNYIDQWKDPRMFPTFKSWQPGYRSGKLS